MKYSKVAQFVRASRVTKAALFSMAVFSQSSFGALYQVTEIQTQDIAINAFVSGINDSGDVVLVSNVDSSFPLAEFNIPIDLTLIDFDNEAIAESMTDLDAARNGNFNLEDYLTILNLIRTGQSTRSQQPLAQWLSYLGENGTISYIPGLDTEQQDFGGYTKAVETRVEGINDNGVMVGVSHGSPQKIEYTNSEDNDFTFVITDHSTRGFVDLNGTIVGLVSDSDLAGGLSEAHDINNGLQVAGFEIFDPTEAMQTAIDACLDEEQRGDQPEELCLNNQQIALERNHQRRGVVWSLDTDGNVTDKVTYEPAIEREDDDDRLFITEAYAINENGIAVGQTTDYLDENDLIPQLFPAIFQNGESQVFVDVNDIRSGSAVDINDNNIVVGNAIRPVNGINREKFFVYNMDTNELTFPDDFFTGSASTAGAINNNGQVVGEGQVESGVSGIRRLNAFLYDINDNSFQNLNDLIACDSPYTLVQANDINDSGEIAAVALARRPQRDIQGNIVLQDDGSQTIVDQLVSVVLAPVPGGQVDDCVTEPPPGTIQERSGSTGLWSILLLPLVWLRRFRSA